VLSGSGEDIDVRRAFELGAHSYFQKPRGFDDLVRVVRLSHEYWTTSLRPTSPNGV
jgi:DNA-binding NarL/FixJ family response regulator